MKLRSTARLLGIAESQGRPKGSTWRVRIITAGESANGIVYSLGVLHESAHIWDGVRVMARPDEDHVQNKNTDPKRVVGWIHDPVAVAEGVDGILELVDGPLRDRLVEAWEAGKKDFLGLSIVGDGQVRTERSGSRTSSVVQRIVKGRSVDIVVNPAAGGGFLQMVAAEGAKTPEGVAMFEKLLALIEAQWPEKHKKLKADLEAGKTVYEDDLVKVLTEATAELREAAKPTAGGGIDPAKPKGEPKDTGDQAKLLETLTALTEALKAKPAGTPADDAGVKLAEAVRKELKDRDKLRSLAESKLARVHPEVQGLMREEMANADAGVLTEAELDAAIEKYGRIVARVSGFQPRVPAAAPAGTGAARTILTESEKQYLALVGLFDQKDQEHNGVKIPRYQSIRRAYMDMTGDRDVTGQIAEAHNWRAFKQGLAGSRLLAESADPSMRALSDDRLLAEAVTTTQFNALLADTMHRVMVRMYREDPQDQWKAICDVVPLADFRPRHVIRMGGYGRLAIVAQAGAYAAITTPADDEETYSPQKRGGTEVVTREAILNDDVGAIRRVPQMLARAAVDTLNYFVLTTLLRGGGGAGATMGDGLAVFHATHANTTTTALAEASLKAGRLSMRKQTILATAMDGSGATTRRLALTPSMLYVPVDLSDTADELTVRLDPSQSDAPKNNRLWQLQPVVVPHWTDTNDWYLFADKSQVQHFEIGFVNGREDPELFTQDMPNVGSMFSNDQLTYKIRHEYGGAPVDWRGMHGALVA